MKRCVLRNALITIAIIIFLYPTLPANTFAADNKFPDALLTIPGTPENVKKGLETDGYTLGIMAYTWGYPLVRMERVIREYIDVPRPKPSTSYRAPLNQIGWARELATPADKDMPTPNNDTLYLSAVISLDEPYVLSVPDTHDRYYVINVFNMWQELEHYVGRRATGTKAGQFVIVPPGWEGSLPANVTRLDVSTSKVWLWGRLRVVGDEPLDSVHHLQDEFSLVPLSAVGQKNFKPQPATLPAMPDIGDDELGFFKHLAFTLKYNDVRPADAALFGQFKRFGLTAEGFDPAKMPAEMKKGLLRGLSDAPTVPTASFVSTATKREGWDWVTGLDSFGFNYPLRTMVAGPYLGGNGEKEAMYPIRFTDSAGAVLTGAKRYGMHFKKAPPVNGFWSISVYNTDGKTLVDNEINRYKIGTDTKGRACGKLAAHPGRLFLCDL